MHEIESDFVHTGSFGLRLSRTYNQFVSDDAGLGTGWRHNYSSSLVTNDVATPTYVRAYRQDGKQFEFIFSAGQWLTDGDVKDKVERLFNAGGATTGWRYAVFVDDTIETYDASGKLITIENRAGLTQGRAYGSTDRLISVTDSFGRALTFAYNTGGRISSITDPAGGIYQYVYDTGGRLISVTYPDLKVKSYVYENASFPNFMTGLFDENGARYASWTYDTSGRATSSYRPGNVELTSVAYNTGNSVVTDTLNTARTYTFNTTLGVVQASGIQQPNAGGTGNVADSRSYDANGNVSSKTDYNNNRTCHAYDLSRNLEAVRGEGVGTAACPADLSTWAPTANTTQRKITTQWHGTFRLPTATAEPLRKTTYVYNGDGGGRVASKPTAAPQSPASCAAKPSKPPQTPPAQPA